MTKSQKNRLAKAARKMRNMQNGGISGDQIINDFEYLIKTVRSLQGKEEKKNAKEK